MKKIILLTLTIFICIGNYAQSPAFFYYQALVRNNSGELVVNQLIGVQIDILQGSTSGTSVYMETQEETTNSYGQLNLKIGSGITTDDINTIDWSNGPYFIQLKMDISGGSSYQLVGTSQILSVPYALHANTVENISESDPVYTAWNKDYNDLTNAPNIIDSVNAVIDTSTQFIRTEVDGDITNEIQNLTLENDTLKLSSNPPGIDLSKLTIQKDWAYLSLSEHQITDIGANLPVKFDLIEGNLTLAGYKITLHAGKVYELSSGLLFTATSTNGRLECQWYDVTNDVYLGNRSIYYPAAETFNTQHNAHYLMKPLTDIEVELRIIVINDVSYINNDRYSYAVIKEL